ncbi:MAG: hypothetical protein LBV21_05195, partial [Candidatus Adiutrix sp.]|nr:hypothetical protein [Candidatus Adiutrix sp.]
MKWGKDFSKLSRSLPPLHSGSGRKHRGASAKGGLLTRLWRKLSQTAPPATTHSKPHHRGEAPSKIQEDLLDDLKIAVPKARLAVPGRAHPARIGPKAEAALKKKFQGVAAPASPPAAKPTPAPAPASPPAGKPAPASPPVAKPTPAPASPPAGKQAPASPPAAKPTPALNASKAAGGGRLTRLNFWRWAVLALAVLAVAGGGFYGYRHYTWKPPRAKVARIPAANLPKVAPLRPGFLELYALERAAAVLTEATVPPGSSLSQGLESAGLGGRNNLHDVLDCLTGGDDPVGVVRPGARLRLWWADPNHDRLSRLEFYPDPGAAPWVVLPRGPGGFWRYNLASRPLSVSGAGEGVVEGSLWNAGLKAGLSGQIIMNIADILAS